MLPTSLDELAVRLLWSLLVLAAAFVAVKTVNAILNRAIERERQKSAEAGPMAGSLLISLGMLVRTVFLYGAVFTAAVVILEIFRVEVVSAADLKNMGLIALKVIGVVVAARLAARFGRTAITQTFARKELQKGLIEDRRAQTLESLLKNGVTYLIFFLAGLMVLQIFNVNTSAILASAGILGLAVGFGAQNLVRDVISGFFIIFEDQFAVGDYVEAAGVVGVVEEIGLRTCKIRRWTGQLQIIPNGEISKVTNYNRGRMMALAVVGIAYEEDIDRAIEVLRRECEAAHREIPAIVEVPVVQGVVALEDFAVKIRAVAMTVPGEQWAVERELLRRFKNALDREGIEIPYPRRVITYREEYSREEQSQNTASAQEKGTV
ncbi:MAG: mechanosensitive ion channel family protein [Peptococcaceae bacterium]|nr:mechanosensitive ion channel family protein [Peptococcaceae bacterium]